jgi:hypothetical protein
MCASKQDRSHAINIGVVSEQNDPRHLKVGCLRKRFNVAIVSVQNIEP